MRSLLARLGCDCDVEGDTVSIRPLDDFEVEERDEVGGLTRPTTPTTPPARYLVAHEVLPALVPKRCAFCDRSFSSSTYDLHSKTCIKRDPALISATQTFRTRFDDADKRPKTPRRRRESAVLERLTKPPATTGIRRVVSQPLRRDDPVRTPKEEPWSSVFRIVDDPPEPPGFADHRLHHNRRSPTPCS